LALRKLHMKNNLSLKHVAIICDGNRRWAREQGLLPIEGHNYAFDHTITNLVDTALEIGLPYLTFWIFSTENWNRPKLEVEGLMRLFRSVFSKKAEEFYKKNVRINHIGEISKFEPIIQDNIKKWVEKTKDNKQLTLTFAANYGGRDEIVRAIKKLKQEDVSSLSENNFSNWLDTRNIPDPELIIRPGGEIRLSGFMLWQCQYSELYFSKVKFPDFKGDELKKAIEVFDQRTRRFGK
jgi:undecaprenyl diphosphate synthase